MDDLGRLYTRPLQVGFLLLDQAVQAGDRDWACAEIQHFHNVPSLIGEENVERHSYFWNEARMHYLDWINTHGSELVCSRMRTYYEPIWDEMAPLIAERAHVVEHS